MSFASADPPISEREEQHAEHFENLERQAEASRFGMWVFLATEVLVFGAAFALVIAYQFEHTAAFREGVKHNTKVLGSINTAVLLVSSTLVAGAVHALRDARRNIAVGLVASTSFLGLVFLAIK